MKKTFIWLVASLLFTMVGCEEGLHEPDVTVTSSEQLPNLTAGFAEGETKTYVESGKYLRWHEDDRLTAFFGNTLNRQYKFDGATGDNSGSFSYISSGNLETGNALDRIYAVYPYDETATITDDGKISLTLPAVQTYAENSFGPGANTMFAVTENVEDTFLGFKNACGYLKLKFYNPEGATIKSVEVKGNGDEKIAGAATATIAFGEVPQLTMADDATTTIALDCGDGVALGTTAEAATEFWVVIPETTFEGGITITVTDTEGGIFEKSTTKEVALERNAIQPMAALEVVCIKRLPKNNKIWYTATEKVEPYDKTVFGATYQSNEWNSATGEGVITFDNEVTTIGAEAFYECSSLTSVTIPDSVTTIGDFAFCCCYSLISVTIPDSVTAIGDGAFIACYSLQEFSGKFASDDGRCLVIEGVLNSFAPAGITGYTIPDSVTTIGGMAFCACYSLTSVTIPDSVTSIGAEAFYDCSSLTSVTIPDSVTTIGGSVFRVCYNLTSVTIGDSVTAIGDRTFSGCYNLTSVTIGDSVTTIGAEAFSGCRSLTSVTIPDSVTTIGAEAFYKCAKLTSVTIGDSVTTIGAEAFYHCEKLTSVTIPDSVTAIGDGAFFACYSLQEFSGKFASDDGRCLVIEGVLNSFAPAGITGYTIPDSVTTIGDRAFYQCEKLTSVTIGDSVTAIGDFAFSGCYRLTSVTIPDSVTTIGDGAFYQCEKLTSVTIGDSVTAIGDRTFIGCYNLTSVTIGDSVTTIGDRAFSGCRSLTSVTIPDSVTAIGFMAFSGCRSLTSIYCKPTTPPTGDSFMFSDNASDRMIYVPMESVSEYKSASYWDDYADAIVGYNF